MIYDNTDFGYTWGKDSEQDNKIRSYLSKSTQFDDNEDDYYISAIANELIDIVGVNPAAAFVDRYLYTHDTDECMRWLFKKLEPYARHAYGNSGDFVREFIKDHVNDIEDFEPFEADDNVRKWTEEDSPTGISNPADYMSKITFEKDTDNDGDMDTKVTVGKAVPGYEDSYVDAGSLSGMLTDTPEVRQATINWMKGLKGKDSEALKNIVSSQTFKDMYGNPDWDED